MTGNNDKHPVCIPLHFLPGVTLEQYQQFFDNCPVCASVENEEFANTGAYVILDYYQEEHKALMRYIRKNSGIVEIDRLYAAVDDKGNRKFSKSAMYKFAGNAVCVDCFVRITEQILDDMEDPHADRGGLDYWMRDIE